ncbi:hypothetical protein JZ785_26590 [Alicyclobacillus curvatus]|nr:hypothetical protein JZ785_26590 [Alicyclobacillus curvatus]
MKWNWKRLLSIEWLIMAVWILGVAMYEMHDYNDPDTPWHYATGQYILAHHVVPTTDPFSWSSHGMPWVTQEWLFELVFAWIGKHFGFPGTWLFQIAIFTATVVILYLLAVRVSKGNHVMAAILACAAQFAGIIFWTMRPQIVSYMMFALFLLILQYVREGRFGVLYWVPVVMLLWANSHGSSTIGILLLLLEVFVSFIPSVGRFVRVILPKGARWRLVLAAVVGAAVGLINPNGIKAYTYALLSNDSQMTNNIMEWHSPDFHMQSFKYGVLPFLMVTFIIVLIRFRTLPLRDILYFGGSFAVMLVYQRFLPYVAIATVPLLAQVTSDWFRSLNRLTKWMRLTDGVLLLAWIAYFATTIPNVQGPVKDHWSSGAYPVGAVNYMESHHLTTRILNKYDWGGYLIYRGIPTFVDGRTDVFLKNGIFMDYLALQNVWWNAPDLLNKYHFQAILFNSGSSLVTYLTHTGQWKVAYYGTNADVLVPITSKVGSGGST